jgi:GntR family transcriptional regulator, transcriptional repressor for pyruvate dehydrogenase complex
VAFELVERRTASAAAIEQIRTLVAAGTLVPGQRLPPERELSELLGVSRPTLREAVRALVAIGVLETRAGSGTYVTDLSPETIAGPLAFVLDVNHRSLLDLFEVRLLLEVAAAKWAAARIDGDALDRLEHEVEALAAWIEDVERFTDADIAFHRIIHESAGNDILLALMSNVSVLDRQTRLLLSQERKAREETIPEHENILRNLRRRSPEGAARAMHRHLSVCWSHLTDLRWERPIPA